MNKLITIYKYRNRYYGFRFDTEIQGFCENFMCWYLPPVTYWMADDEMFKNGEEQLSIDPEYPHNYLVKGKTLHLNDVHVHKDGMRYTLGLYHL